MNPYARFLGDRKAFEVIAESPARLAALSKKLGPDGMKRRLAPEKWQAQAILCHLADCELAFGFRYRQALAEPHHVIQPFDQDAWAKSYGWLDPEAALEMFTVGRRWNLALLRGVRSEDFSRTLNHPERGDMTLQTVVETMAGHDLNHIAQLETLAAMQ